MTTIEKIKKMNNEMQNLRSEIPGELKDFINKANKLITPSMEEEIERVIEDEVGGSHLCVDYGYLSTDPASDYHSIGYLLAYDIYGNICVISGNTGDFDGSDSSIEEAVKHADMRDIENMYSLLERLIESLTKNELLYEV